MCVLTWEKALQRALLSVLILAVNGNSLIVSAQTKAVILQKEQKQISVSAGGETNAGTVAEKPLVVSILPKFYDRQTGESAVDLVRRALGANGELIAARLEIEKARARLVQAHLRPNPTLEIEQTSGRLLGSGGDGDLSVGATLPLELFGQRKSRITLAEIEITAREAEIVNRERQLAADVLSNYVESLAALREIETIENLLELDLQTTRFVQIRVNEGDTAPLELNLLQVEVERLRARRQLAEGRFESSLTKLKLLAGMNFDEPLRLREQINNVSLPPFPMTREAAIDVALRTRPDIRIAQIEEELAAAGLRLIRVQSKPDVAVTTRYTQSRSGFDNTPIGDLTSRDRTLTFGVSIGLPIFNRNQGAKTEAGIAIRQAQQRREFAERVVRSEVTAAFQRIEAANRALATLETGVLPRAEANIKTLRAVYELGEIKITDLIAEQRRLLEANQDLTETLTMRFRANADLITALGASIAPPK